MSYQGCVALLVCGLAVVSIASLLPYLNSHLRGPERTSFPLWQTIAGAGMLVVALFNLRRLNPAQPQAMNAVALTAALVAGIGLKWLLETLAQKRTTIHEAVLLKTLIFAPLSVAAAGGLFGTRPAAPVFLLWFLNGFFWHTVFSDFERLLTPVRVIIRRREPPTLPHDFHKPKTG